MANYTPQIENVLTEIVETIRSAIDQSTPLNRDAIDQLVKALATNGWERHSEEAEPLQVILENRIVASDSETSMHHPEQAKQLALEVQEAYQDHARYQSSMPNEDKPVAERDDLQAQPPRSFT